LLSPPVQSTPLLISFPLFLFFKKQKRGGMERRGEERRGEERRGEERRGGDKLMIYIQN